MALPQGMERGMRWGRLASAGWFELGVLMVLVVKRASLGSHGGALELVGGRW